VRVGRLRAQIADAGFKVKSEDLYVTGTFRNLPFAEWLRDSALTQDIVIGHVQYVIEKDAGARAANRPHDLDGSRRIPGPAV
jgi:hypothetical protein